MSTEELNHDDEGVNALTFNESDGESLTSGSIEAANSAAVAAPLNSAGTVAASSANEEPVPQVRPVRNAATSSGGSLLQGVGTAERQRRNNNYQRPQNSQGNYSANRRGGFNEPVPPKRGIPGWATALLIIGGLGLCASLIFNFIMLIAIGGNGEISAKNNNSFIEKTIEGKGRDKIVYIQQEGAITSSPVEYGSGIRDKVLVDMLAQAQRDPNVKGLILEINSPGGEVTASDKLNRAIQNFVAQKPLYFLMGDLCASGCVYMSTHASKIYAHPTTTTGSIGVIMHNYNLQKLMEKVGVKAVTIKSGDMKDILSSSREMTPAEQAILQNMIMESYDRFVNLVATGRKLEVEAVKEFADGRILTTSQAVKVGLVDQVAYYSEVKDELMANLGLSTATVVTYKRPFSIMDFGESQMMKLGNSPINQLSNAITTPRMMYLWQLPELE